MAFVKALVVDTRYRAQEDLEQQEQVGVNWIR